MTPAFTLTGATKQCIASLSGIYGASSANNIAPMANSIPCDSLQQWSNQYDFDNAGANTYVNKVYLRTQDAGNANNVPIALVDTVYIGNQVVTVSCSAVSVKGIPTVSWVQFDFEANGESHLFTWTILPRTGNIFLSMIIVQGEARGPVYE